MHLFAGHEQLLPLTGSRYSSISSVSFRHTGSSEFEHKTSHLGFAVPLTKLHVQLSLQSNVI